MVGLWALPAASQELNRQVEVTKAYIPTTQSAEKRSIEPQMEDTVALRPEGTYQIRSVAWQTDFQVDPIAAATLDARLTSREPRLLLRAGMGWPLGSRLDARLHHPFYEGYAGGYARHRGQFAELSDDLDELTQATSATNALGAYVYKKLARQLSLKAEADGSWDYFTRYGQGRSPNVNYIDGPPALPAPSIQSYLRGGVKLSLGNDFMQDEHFSYRLSAAANTLTDRLDNGQEELHAALALGYHIGASRICLDGRWDIYRGKGDLLAGYKNTTWSLRPTYEFARNRFNFLVGASVVGDRIELSQVDDFYVFPRLAVRWDLSNGQFVPFLEVDGRVENNGLRSLVERNPYMYASVLPHNTATYEGLIGLAGSIDGAFAYKLFGGGAIVTNHVYFDYIYQADQVAGFAPDMQDVAQWMVGGEVSANIAGNVELRLAGSKYFYDANSPEGVVPGGDEEPAELPEWRAGFEFRYTLRDRLTASAGFDAIGPRNFYALGLGEIDQRVDTQVDFHVKADLAIDRRWGVWVEGRNLLGQNLYPYHHYRLPRSVMVGVSLRL